MKILHVIPSISPRCGGPTHTVLGLARSLVKKGHKVEIFTTNLDGVGRAVSGILDVPLGRVIERDGIKIRYFSVQYPRWAFSWDLFKALRVAIKRTDIVHIYSLYLFTTLATAYCCERYNVPYLLHLHGSLDPFLRRKNRVLKGVYQGLIEHHNWNNAAAIHYNSQKEMELAHNALKIKVPGVVVPCGLNVEEYSNLPPFGIFKRRYLVLRDKKILLFLSRINFKKGLDILARAFGEVARKRNDVYLVLAGPDNEGYAAKVRAWLQEERALGQSLFTGMLLGEEKLAVLRDSDLFVLPSYTENFGIAVVEAMACGLPVIISNKVNIWREVFQAGAGIVTDCDSHQVAEAILKLLDDPKLAKNMGKRGKRLVGEKYTWDKATEQMIKVYEDILNGRLKGTGNSTPR